MSLEQYQQLEAKLAALIPKVKFSKQLNLKLERITHLLQLLGDPHKQFVSIHVGGTSGKGSTAMMCAAILTQAGYKTGLHVSPHLQLLNERHQIDGVIAPTSRLLALLTEMEPAIVQVADDLPFGTPSYFEVQFALSCLYFAREGVEVAVIEVGLGGTLDATNVLPVPSTGSGHAKVAVLTSVGLDHTEILGDTIEKIITDKAGIIKQGQTVITGVHQPSAHAIIAERCRSLGNPLWSLDDEIEILPNGIMIEGQRTIANIELGLQGEFQQRNAGCAIGAALAFDSTIGNDVIRTALRNVRFAGRMEQIQHNPTVILDGAHNPDKIRAAVASMGTRTSGKRGELIVILGMKAGKDFTDVLAQVVPQADRLIVTQFVLKGLWEAVSAETLATTAQTINPNLPITIEPDPIEAIKSALNQANPDDIIWVTGSLYLIGNVRQYWYANEVLIESAETRLPSSLTVS